MERKTEVLIKDTYDKVNRMEKEVWAMKSEIEEILQIVRQIKSSQ
jgi:hypothetical protein